MLLPDLPRWVEANAIAASPDGWQVPGAVGNDQLVVIHDAVDDLAALANKPQPILVADEAIATALRAHRRVAPAILHELRDRDVLPDPEGIAPLPIEAAIDHLPAPLLEEIARARVDRTIWTAWVDAEPVAFAYAPWRTAMWFDTSVEVLASARQLGLGTLVASALIHDELAQGRSAVWGADEDNHASLRLAARLGFVAIDRVWIAT